MPRAGRPPGLPGLGGSAWPRREGPRPDRLDAGRGFAVVATEVRSLAQRASEAAKEIGALIAESGRNVSLGAELVGHTGSALASISESVIETATMVETIAEASQQQADGITEVNSSVADLDRVTQKNAALFQETTALSLTLKQQTQILAAAVARFKLPARADPAARQPSRVAKAGRASVA